MPYDTGLANRLRNAGLRVKETDGWKSRGNSSNGDFHPEVFVVHHTAGAPPSAGVAPSLGVIVNGRSDLAGPLANLYMDYDGTVYTVAAGAANHAGSGSWKGVSGNSRAYGIEIEHPGTYPLDEERAELAARAIAATIGGRFGSAMVCQHKEWSTAGKIDLATAPGPGWWRDRAAYYIKNPGGDWLMALSNDEQERLLNAAVEAAEWARGHRVFRETFIAAGYDLSKTKQPGSLNTDTEKAGWHDAKTQQELYDQLIP